MADPNGWPDASKPGVPLNPERDGTHLIQFGGRGIVTGLWWNGPPHSVWRDRYGDLIAPADLEVLFDYVGPAFTPAEVAALVAEARRAGAQDMRERAARTCEAQVVAVGDMSLIAAIRDKVAEFRCAAAIRALPMEDTTDA